jgi:hypothetical protein
MFFCPRKELVFIPSLGNPEKDLYFRLPRGKIQKKIDRKLEDP